MIDLSFLTEAEQEAILKVLNRDAELKKTEDQRVRELQDKVNDENELKYKSGQWFYEAKSRRHRDKIHGADLVRASIRKRKKPATIAELSQSSRNQSQRSWVNSINQDIFIPPELYGVMEPPDEKEEDLMPSKADTNQSAKRVSFKSPGTDKDVMKNGTASPSRQRKNPFNSEGALEERDLNIESPEPMLVNGQEGKKRDPMSSVYKLGVKLPYPSPIGSRRSSQEAEENPPMKQPPVPKPRKLVINGQPPEHSNSSLQREDSLNSKNKRKGILKRRSSSSSTDSESLRISQNIEPTKLVLPSSPILEAEQSPSFDDQILSDNSPDRQKQVRFSERVLQKPPTPNPESYSVRETDEFGILEPGSHYYDFDFVDHPHYEESKPTQHSQNITEVLSQRSLEEDPISLTLQTNPSEWKLEDPSQGIKINGVNGTLDESSPEISIDSAGTEPLYAEVKKSPKSTSSDQAKDIETDALMEPRFHSQGWKTENTEKPLEFGKSYGGGGKINYGLRSSTDQPGKGYASTNEDILAPEKATNVQSSSQNFVDEPKPGTNGDYFPKWRRPRSMEIDDVVAQPMAEQEFPNVNVRDYTDTFVKAYPENSSNNSLGEFKTETKRQTISLRNAPNVDGRQEGPSSNFPIAQNMSISSRPASGDFKTHDTFLRDGRDRRISPTSANFKVMSMKDRIHDTSREQMSNPSQFQSLRHFWNAEDKNWSKGDLDPSPEKILTNVSKRNKPTRADLKQRHSRDVPTDDQSLPSSFDSLSEEEQTSQKVTSWLAQTPTVYGVEEVDANEDQDHSGEEVMENIEKTLVYRKRQDEEFSNALQKLKHEALEAPVMPKTEHLRSEDFQVSPVKESGLFDRKENKTSILVKSAESRPATGFYERVVQISNKQSPAKEEEKFVEPPSQRYSTEVDEHVNRTVAPAKMANEFKIGFQKLQEEYESASSQCDDERQVEKSNLPSEEQQLIETNETVDITSVPKGNDHQEFISALKRLEMEASTPSIVEDEDEQPEEVATVNTVTPVKSSFQIGFDHHTPIENEGTFETPQKLNVTYAIQSSPPYNEDTNGIEEVVLKTTAPSKKDDNDLVDALNKLELEAAAEDSSVELEEVYEKPKITPTIQSARSNSGEQSFVTPSVDVQNLSSPTHSVESTPENEDAYLYRTRRSTQEADDTFDGQGKLPVEEPPIEKTISDTEESNSDYKNRLLRLEEEAAASITEEPEDESVRETFSVSPAPTKEVTISKKVFSSVETTPTELPSSQPKPDTYKELANVPQSPSDQSGSFPGSARNVLYTKPDSSEVLKSKQGMDESNPILKALQRSTAKTLNSTAVQETSPTSTNQSKLNSQKADTLGPVENTFPENAEKFKRMSQSVPTFLQDETDGRETDSASESSFQIGRHKKSPSSLTNLSGSSGMASMSSVSGSVMSVYSGDFGNVDVKGAIEFAIDYVEQLKEFHIFIYQCKDLAAADVKKQRSDPYVKSYLLPEKAKMGKRKTAVKKKTLNPIYNEILRYKIPQESLKSQTLNVSVWHHDALGRNSFLGEVNLNLAMWDFKVSQRHWFPLEPRTPVHGVGLENRGEMKLALMYIPVSPHETGKKPNTTGEVHIWIKECLQLPMLRENKINSFVKCTILPDTSRKSRQKTRTIDKTQSPFFNHTMVYDGFKEADLREACVELTAWDHNKLSNHFIGGLRLGFGTGKSYGTAVDWMDSSLEEATMWEKMIASPSTWIEGLLPLRMFKMAKLSKYT
ncbi:uncharacterized protein [Engystomops pustulosus]|uniref:uncharacterized protein isoform X10 n=1 Tax=Engystomops pustulosus TaxID=76066 RepID=UPI003AFADD1C